MPMVHRFVQALRRTPLHPQWLIATERRAMARVLAHATGVVLDVGCADRWLESRLPAGCSYVGLDYPATGRILYGARPSMFADAARLPLADSSVDTVLLFEVLEHLARPATALAEACRVLRPGGRLLASVPFLYPVHDAPHDFQRYTEHGLRLALVGAGFEVEHLSPRLDAVSSAGLLASLALGGSARESMARPGLGLLLLPVLLALIPVVNVAAFLLAPLATRWQAMTNGYVVVARVAPTRLDMADEDGS